MNAIENLVENVKDWTEARDTERHIRRTQARYTGCEVVTRFGYTGIITHLDWCDTWNSETKQFGTWLARVRFMEDGTEENGIPEYMTLTGKRYADRAAIEAARPVHPDYASLQQWI